MEATAPLPFRWQWHGLRRLGRGRRADDIENLIATEFDDSLTGDANHNRLDGGRGDDILVGLDGDDILIGERGADQLFGGEGVDTADYSLAGITEIDLDDGTAIPAMPRAIRSTPSKSSLAASTTI